MPAYVAQVKACGAAEDYGRAIELAEEGVAKFEKTRDSAEAAGVLESLVEAMRIIVLLMIHNKTQHK